MEYFQLLLIFLGGIAGGFYGSLVGGGALVSFPLLILTGMPTQFALGTLRFAVVFLELVSAIRFHKAQKINFGLVLPLGIVGTIGSIVGVNLVLAIDTKVLNLIVGVMLLFVALFMFYKEKLGIKEHIRTRKHIVFLFLSMIVLGFYTGFFGAGAGVFNSLLFVFFGFSLLESAAMGRVVGLCTSLVSALIFAQHGFIDYTVGITLGIGFAIGSWIGIGIALKKGDRYIKGLIGFVVLLSILKLILNSFGIEII